MNTEPVRRYARCFETLDESRLPALLALFSEDARFIDPFNRVAGRAAIGRVFEHMFQHYPTARFEILEEVGTAPVFFLRWRFHPHVNTSLQIEGVSRVQLNANGLVDEHCDYWDTGTELYTKLPFLGPLARWLRRKSTANPSDQIKD